ncbi:MAG: ATP-binding protein [Pseudomonadota bacterium]
MNVLTRLRHALEFFLKHSPFRWVALFLVVSIFTGTIAYSYIKIDNDMTAAALARREAVAQLVAAMLAEKFGRSSDVAVALATRVRFKELVAAGKWDEAIEIMHDVPLNFPYIDRLFLADVDGTLQADMPALPGVRGIDFSSRDWFRGVSRNWQPYVSPVYTRAGAPKLNVFAIAVPVKNTAGRVMAILVLKIHIENWLQWLAEIDLEKDASTYIVDSEGQLAFHSKHGGQKEIVNLSSMPIVQKLRRGEQGVEIGFDAAGHEQSITAYAAIPGYGWGVVVQQPVRSSHALAARDNQLRQLLVGYGLILLFGLTTAILILRIVSARQKAESDRQLQATLERHVLERTMELQAANRELEAFSYSVSHDLRAPLRSIDGFSLALLEDYAERFDDQAKDYLNRIRSATQRMGHLIDDMLILSRVTRVEMRRAPVDLSALATNVLEELQKNEPERKVDWRVEPALTAEGDVDLLRMVLANLLDNAWKYTARQKLPRIEVGMARNAGGAMEFFVRDNGVGFDMAYAGKLFGAFQRMHSASEFPGTGVGLAIVQRVIHRHGGQVRGEAAVGRGATFYFTLPV